MTLPRKTRRGASSVLASRSPLWPGSSGWRHRLWSTGRGRRLRSTVSRSGRAFRELGKSSSNMASEPSGRQVRQVLLAGTFDPDFARNRVIVSLLERSGFDVRVVQHDLWGSVRYTLLDLPKLRLAGRALVVYAR